MFGFDLLFKKRIATTLEEAIAKFKGSPENWFTYRSEKFLWPEYDQSLERPVHPDDMRVLVDGHTLGFVELVSCQGNQAKIGHIAVAGGLEGRGIGKVLARAYANQLYRRYGVTSIVFSEIHREFLEKGYPAFFKKLGAVVIPVDPKFQRPDRPDYLWLKENW